jgi:hypothetical protein
MYQLLAATLQKLEGTTHDMGGIVVRFVEGGNGRPAAWAGGEGYAAPVRLASGAPHFLKIFRLPTAERRLRARFLSSLELGSLPLRQRLFEAAPTRTVQAAIDVPDEGNLAVEGHLAPSIPGKSFEGLLQESWEPSLDARVGLARQLCAAVEVLEGGGLTHGDLSAANIMVVDAGGPRPELRFIDFDGFHHEGVPPVPYTAKEKGGRAWGTPGYRAPAFKRGPDVLVTSDRVAMGILALELIALRHDDELPQDHLLDQREIDARSPRLPDEIAARWPAGWEMVQRAIAEHDPARAPSPEEWRRELGRVLSRPSASVPPASRSPGSLAPAFLVLVREVGQQDRQVKLRGLHGSFGQISPALGWLSYQITSSSIHLTGATPTVDGRATPLFARHGGPKEDLEDYRGNVAVDAKLGDVVIWDDFQVYLG